MRITIDITAHATTSCVSNLDGSYKARAVTIGDGCWQKDSSAGNSGATDTNS